MKKQMTSLLALALLAGAKPAAAQVQVAIDSNLITFEQAPFIHNDLTLVPMREIFTELGAEIAWDPPTQTVTATKDSVTIQLKIGSSYALKNFQQVSLDTPAMIRHGRTFVPLRFIGESLGATVGWDGPSRTVQITSEQLKAEQDVTPALSFDQAVQWAVANAHTVKMAEQDIERKELNREDASSKIDFIPINEGNGPDEAAVRSAWRSLLTADMNLQLSKKEIEVTQDQVTYRVKQAYQDILVKENDVRNKEEALEVARMEERATLAKAQIGKVSEVDKNRVIKATVEAEKNWQLSKTALQEAQGKLNTLMGKTKSTVYKLADQPLTHEIEAIDIDYHVAKILSSSPTIWRLEKQVELAKLGVTLFSWNAGQNYQIAEMDVTQAQATLAENKKQQEESLRTAYASLKQLEEQVQLRKLTLETAEEQVRVAQSKFDRGLITALEVKKEQTSLNQRKRELEELAIRIDQALFTLHKPWAS
ncbi:stalk domain-containing protein [Ammoniphilus sp. YIM 78166]|uniref:stalk domain-containing protein n=1 Tax=Ammoniphilus sp. YIM 78166 TaxID=1644106 RepID=UPI0010705702|nr:stalk domain-containing protein [Ammoniphilus sp. YIM 78166]